MRPRAAHRVKTLHHLELAAPAQKMRLCHRPAAAAAAAAAAAIRACAARCIVQPLLAVDGCALRVRPRRQRLRPRAKRQAPKWTDGDAQNLTLTV